LHPQVGQKGSTVRESVREIVAKQPFRGNSCQSGHTPPEPLNAKYRAPLLSSNGEGHEKSLLEVQSERHLVR
jgi:hypothetical protein